MNQQGTDAYEIWAGAFGAPHPFAVQQLQLVASVSDDRPLQFCTTAVKRPNGVLSSKCFDPADQRASVLLASSESKNPGSVNRRCHPRQGAHGYRGQPKKVDHWDLWDLLRTHERQSASGWKHHQGSVAYAFDRAVQSVTLCYDPSHE